ncbi:MAG TPA: Mut7-C RNAse domain-containing protein [Candidatus Elarobacter sp.]|nr:Mut7-C RNAse domain-containing protein [Candidatus Elarobacter sp.]
MPTARFVADAMLGRLARWLRVLGFDTVYDPPMHDTELVALASSEQRILLTRDRHLLRELRPQHALEIRTDAPLQQLRDVIEALDLIAPAELFTRCLVCNTPLSDVGDAEIEALVPPATRELPGPIRRCPNCARVYWPGSHVRRMRRALEGALPGWLDHTDGRGAPEAL